jgi:hypothetical protein
MLLHVYNIIVIIQLCHGVLNIIDPGKINIR